ncbi:MAG TPA: response regulator, partial [Holophagaceae bacterium]|nr:response regulator [Holophagaceae bacterium]
LNANRLNIKQIPFVLQYNKRDLADAMPVGVMNRRLNFRNVPFFEARANKGLGVRETFLAITRETVEYTFKKYHLDKKVRDFRELMALVDNNLQESFREPEDPGDAAQDTTILRHSGVTIETLPVSGLVDPGELLEDALKSNMETARLYSDLKGVKEDLERKHSELVEVNKQLERAHQDGLKTRRFLEQLVQNIGDAVVSFSLDGKVLTWNAAAERIFGYSRPEIIGKPFGTLLPPAEHTELAKIIQRVAQGQTLRGLRGACLRKAGIPFASAMTYAPVKSADDRVIAISGLIRDLEEHPALGPAPPVPPMLEASAKRLEPALAEARAILESAMDPDQAGRSAKLVRLLEEVQAMLRGSAPTAPVPLPEPPKAAAPAPAKGGRVLLVDDESAILDCMAEALEAWGHAPTSCSRGEEAVQALKAHDYDLVISDIRMPGLSGIDLFNWIQVNRPQLKGHVLFTTGDAFDGTTLDFLDQHGLKHLPKPFDLRQLQRSVTEMLTP